MRTRSLLISSSKNQFKFCILRRSIDYEVWETGCPILPSALAIFECRKLYTYDGGDHAIFVGEVLKFDHDPKGKPLVFWRGGYHRTVS